MVTRVRAGRVPAVLVRDRLLPGRAKVAPRFVKAIS
jgi:hypothetical protein